MKKVSLFALLLSAGTALFAQSSTQLRTPMEVAPRFGVKAGVNLATTALGDIPSGATEPNANNKTGFYGGVFVNLPLGSSMFKFQPELLYSSQGTKLDRIGGYGEGELDLNYVALPLMVQLQTPGGFYVEVGPQVALMTNSKYQINSGSEIDYKDFSDKFDFSVNAGVGYMTRIGLGINARYNYGITNLIDAKNSTAPSYSSFREAENRIIQLGLFYQFGASK